MNSLQHNPRQDNPRRVSRLEYAKMVQEAHGPDTPVTWLSVSDLIALLEQAEIGARMEARTIGTIRRIAELRIQANGLNCTVDEYLEGMGR